MSAGIGKATPRELKLAFSKLYPSLTLVVKAVASGAVNATRAAISTIGQATKKKETPAFQPEARSESPPPNYVMPNDAAADTTGQVPPKEQDSVPAQETADDTATATESAEATEAAPVTQEVAVNGNPEVAPMTTAEAPVTQEGAVDGDPEVKPEA